MPSTQRAGSKDPISHPGSVLIDVQGAFIVDEAAHDGGANGATDSSDDEFRQPATQDIRLPNHRSVVSHIAVDIGGSLAKLVYFTHEPHQSSLEHGGRLHFQKFESDKMDGCIATMRRLKDEHQQQQQQQGEHGAKTAPTTLCVMATGGGAFKYNDDVRQALGVEVLREDEMECLIMGLDFFISEIPNEVFTYSESEPAIRFVEQRSHGIIYPYLLVNIGSGVSMIKVSGPRQFQRVGGTSLGGGTLWGLLSLLTGARSFEEMLRTAERGDNAAVDMLVGDIYGTDYAKIGLKSTAIASSFGKVYRLKRQAERDAEDHGGLANADSQHDGDGPGAAAAAATTTSSFRPEDISRSLLYAVSNNIGQIAYLHAQRHNLEHIYFGGSFIGGHRQTMNTLSYAIKFWSNGEKQAYFLRHEGYLGAVGAFLKRQPLNWGRRNSFNGVVSRVASGQ